jgi:hypothetical protein
MGPAMMNSPRWFLFLLSLTFTASPACGADNWPEFRGPTGDGQATAKGLPTRWSETENVCWKTAIHDKGWSSPVVWGDQVWLTTARADGKEYFALCVDRNSGNILHDIKVFEVAKPEFCHPFNSYASSTPAIEAGRLYAHFGTHGTACLDTATGKILWERRDLHCNHFRGAASSPILFGNVLILIFDGSAIRPCPGQARRPYGLEEGPGHRVSAKQRRRRPQGVCHCFGHRRRWQARAGLPLFDGNRCL